jgi:hypothetical protein
VDQGKVVFRGEGSGEGVDAPVLSDTLKYIKLSPEDIKRGLNRKRLYECRCDERLRAKAEGSTRLTYTGLRGGLEHLKIETRLRDERFESVKGECLM